MPYTNPVAKHARVIPHDYFDASDNPAQFDADKRNCQAVTAALMAEPQIADVTFWYYRQPYPDEPGTMVLCDGVDPRVDGSAVDIWTYNGSCYSILPPTIPVYVSKDALVAAGYDIPENINCAHREWKERSNVAG